MVMIGGKYAKRSNVKFAKKLTRAKKQSSISPAVKQYVKTTMRKEEETKKCSDIMGITSFNSGISSSGDFIDILPTILQGTAENNRIGSAIRPIKLVIRGYVSYVTNSFASGIVDARMLGVRLFCFSDKTQPCYTTNLSAGSNYNILDQGGSSAAFTGTITNYLTPHNSDQFKFYADKSWVMLKPFGTTNNTTPSPTNAIPAWNSTVFRPFTITIKSSQMPATLKYDQAISVGAPVNFAPFLALGYTDLQNSLPDVVTQQIEMSYVATLYYKDS